MIVCLCANVSEKKLAAAIAGGATTLKEIGRRCGAGVACGACRPLIREHLRRSRAAAGKPADRGVAAPGEALTACAAAMREGP